MAYQLSTHKKLAFSTVAVLGFLLIAGLIAEVALRLAYRRVENITGVLPWSTSEWEGITYHWDEYHPLYGWTNVANYQSDARLPVNISINSNRLRDTREITQEKPPGVKRILVFGDSFTFGDEVNNDETIPHLIESQLSNAQVLNFGIHGQGPGQWMLRMETEAFDYQPDHIVVVYPTLDFSRLQSSRLSHEKPLFYAIAGELEIDNIPVPELSREPWLYRNSFAAAWLLGRRAHASWGKSFEFEVKALRLVLERMQRISRANRVPLTIVHIPEPMLIDDIRNNAKQRKRVLKEIRMALADSEPLDLFDAIYLEYEAQGAAWLAPQGHWNGEANQFIAESIVTYLTERDPTLLRLPE